MIVREGAMQSGESSVGLENPFEQFYVDVDMGEDLSAVWERLAHDGLVTFDRVMTRADLLYLGNQIGEIYVHRDAAFDGITEVRSSPVHSEGSGYSGFTDNELILHIDRSGVENPPTFGLLYCHEQASTGGETILADGKAIYEQLVLHQPELLEELSEPQCAVFGGGESLVRAGVFSQMADGSTCIRCRFDQLGYYNAVVANALPILMNVIDRSVVKFRLRKGQGYLLLNRRWLHGRTAFEGAREMWRVLISRSPITDRHARIPDGFFPE
jgi:alpha-ketoglutarate-dependent taurine dioxygenase